MLEIWEPLICLQPAIQIKLFQPCILNIPGINGTLRTEKAAMTSSISILNNYLLQATATISAVIKT
jgi:hypothetical protein